MQYGKHREKRRKIPSQRNMWNTTKCTNIHVMEVTEGEKKEKGKYIQGNNGRKLPKSDEKYYFDEK